MTYKNQTSFAHTYDKFEYSENYDCSACANFKRSGSHGCGRSVCEFQDLKDEAIKNNRRKRMKGWRKQCTEE